MRNRRVLPKLFMSIALGSSLALLSVGAALAEAPRYVMLPDAACNQGTASARVISGNGIVPMYMTKTPVGCMTMPGAFHP